MGQSWHPVVKRAVLLKAVFANGLLLGKGLPLCSPEKGSWSGWAGKSSKKSLRRLPQWPQTLQPSACKIPLWVITNLLSCMQMWCRGSKSIPSH